MDISKLDNHITNFLAYLRDKKHRNSATIRNYTLYLSRFSKWARNNGLNEPEMITSKAVKEYKYWLNGLKNRFGKGLNKNTKNYHLIALRSFLKYLRRTKLKTIEFQEILLEKIPRAANEITGSVLGKLLNAPLVTAANSENVNAIVVARDKAILEMFASTGITVSEAAKLRKKDFIENLRECVLNIEKEKGKRSIILSNQAAHWMKKYISLRNDLAPFLFVSHDKGKIARHDRLKAMSSRTFQRIVEKYARASGIIERISPRVLRRCFAIRAMNKETDLNAVKKILGHKSIGATKNLCSFGK